MINDIIILDNLISVTYQNYIETELLGEYRVPWALLNDISYQNSLNDTNIKECKPGLVHVLKGDGQVKSHYYNLLLPLVFNSVDNIGFDLHDIFQGRCFLQFPYIPSRANNPHVDLEFPHLVCLYYINDSDGDTIIYNETNLNGPLTIKQQISPKKGRVVLFGGKYYHSSSNPTLNQRCIVNFNLV